MNKNIYVTWYGRIVWIGIALNMVFVIGLFFFPIPFLALLNIPAPPTIWVRTAGMLLAIISAFYIPGAIDPMRYRWTAIFSVIPSRTFGSTFFLTETLVFGWPIGFVSIGLVDLTFGLIEAVLLYKAYRLEPTA
jgi:hypothetical protein